jgi:protein-arginine kinase activator protein McsA
MEWQEIPDRYIDFHDRLADIKEKLTSDDRRGSQLVRCKSCNGLYSLRFAELTGEQCVECYKEQQFGTIIPR